MQRITRCTCSATYISQSSPLKSARDRCREKALQSLWKHPQLAFIYTSQAFNIVGCVYCWRNITRIKWLTGSFKPLPMKVNWNRENGDKWDLVNICSRIEVTVTWKCTVVHLAGALMEFFIHFNDLVVANPLLYQSIYRKLHPSKHTNLPPSLTPWNLIFVQFAVTNKAIREQAKPNSVQDFWLDWSRSNLASARSTPISCLFNFFLKIDWHVTNKQMQICRFCFYTIWKIYIFFALKDNHYCNQANMTCICMADIWNYVECFQTCIFIFVCITLISNTLSLIVKLECVISHLASQRSFLLKILYLCSLLLLIYQYKNIVNQNRFRFINLIDHD